VQKEDVAVTLEEAKAKLDATLDELHAAGFDVWGWDDESIQLSDREAGRSVECAPRHGPRGEGA